MYTKKKDLKGYQSSIFKRRIRCLLGLHDPELFTLYGELGEVVSKCNNLSEVSDMIDTIFTSCKYCNKTIVRLDMPKRTGRD